MPRLGVLLVRAGAVTDESVNRALAVQGFAGGRIGSLLLERGSVSEDDVGRALAEQHGCEYIPWSVLGAVPASMVALLPAKFAIRHSAIPVEIGGGYLRVALRDPANLRILDELFFVTGRKIVPAAAPEVRIYQALERYYGERRTPRFAILAEKLSRPSMPSVIKKAVPPPPDFSAPKPPQRRPPVPPAPPAPGKASPLGARAIPDDPPVGWGGLPPSPRALGETEPESIPWEELPGGGAWPEFPQLEIAGRGGLSTDMPLTPPDGVSPPPPPPVPISQTEAQDLASHVPAPADFSDVVAARDRDGIFDAALSALRGRFPKSAIFVARSKAVSGWAGAGSQVDVAALRSLAIPWSEPSVFLNVRLNRTFYLGPLPPLPRHNGLAAALGGWPLECVVQPVLMLEKTVAFFYAECPGAQGATPADLTYVRELARAAAAALAGAIRLRKKHAI